MNKKVIIDKLQNEKAAKECGAEIEIGKEYELPLKGKCVIHSNYYQLEDNDEKSNEYRRRFSYWICS